MKHTVTIKFTHSFVRSAVQWTYARRAARAFVSVALIFLAAGFFASDGFRDLNPTLLSILCGGLFAAAGILIWGLRRQVADTIKVWKRQAPDETIHFHADENGLEIEMNQGKRCYRWRNLKRLVRQRNIWLFEVVHGKKIPFPAAQASDDMKDFILRQCEDVNLPIL